MTSASPDWIAGLRELADWLEQHPELPVRRLGADIALFDRCSKPTVEEVRAFAALYGFTDLVEYPDDVDGIVCEIFASRSFGPFTVEVWGQDPCPHGESPRRPTIRERVKAVFS